MNLKNDKKERLIRIEEVLDRVGYKKTQLFENMKDGTFPKSIKISARISVWIESEIDEYIDDLISSRKLL